MAQPAHLNQNLPDLGGPFLYRDQEEEEEDGDKASYSLETPYGFLLDLDFLKYVDDIEKGQSFRKLLPQRKSKGAKQAPNSSRSQTSGWISTESLSSTTSADRKSAFSPRHRLWASSSDIKEPVSKQASLPASPSPIIHLLPPPPPKSLTRNTRVEETLQETSKRLEEEQLGLLARGLSATIGVPGSPARVVSPQDHSLTGESLPGSVKLSPSNSGRSTPATAVGPAHLQHVREQMATALKQLKELEEQVKIIPVLEKEVCRLKEEKEQLLAGLWEKLEMDGGETCVFNFPPKSPNAGAPDVGKEGSRVSAEVENDGEPSKARTSKITELKRLTEKLSGSERARKTSRGAVHPSKTGEPTCQSVGVGEEVDMNEAVFYYRCHKPSREVAVGREPDTKDAEVWVMESLLGVSSEAEKEIQLLQETVQHQREVISMLEGHLQEASDELEELRVEVCSRLPKGLTSKETMARPLTVEASVEAAPATQCQAVGSHIEMADKSVHCCPQVTSVGVGCSPQSPDLAPVQCGGKAAQIIPEAVSKAPREDGRSAPAEPDRGTAADASVPEDAKPGKLPGHEECRVSEASLQTESLAIDLDLLPHSVTRDQEDVCAQRESGENSTGAGALKSIMKKRGSPAKTEAGSGKKSLQFVGFLNGEFELSPRLRDACLLVRSHLTRDGTAAKSKEVLSSTSLILQEWFRLSSQKASLAGEVAEHLMAFAEISPALLSHVINLSDGNGNTALHYSVSHSNFDIVQLLLDTGICNVNYQNKAGYTALMLTALATVEQEEEMAVVRRLFGMGNVNAKASQAGQTALMLAVSHGRQEMVEALLSCGADINLQDEEGSTALMCACEHGRAGTVRLLLTQPDCDASIVDNEGNDAVSIALEAGHSDIAASISTHLAQSAACSPGQEQEDSQQ
ncbi:KN motif and ankyrin repeat domain-containing protein 3 isoform X4 [Zootoca vivipara]|uniref:KN motif and ankyrin repeat domain-containing protein 3 isoform X4 n=1 Tax=Zootoca vivipara TaxID=8524 RepID=UPI00293BA39C|nr:KN motif and ankyrin repeat domain-containing protein 3 isoform X4 [Zootoca vivipara]